VTRNRSLTANFALDTHPLTITTAGHGAVTRSPNQASYDYGTVVTLTPVPEPGMAFVSWSGDTATTAGTLVVTMTGPRAYTAQFTYGVSATSSGNGTVTKSPDQLAFAPGSSVTLTATPDAGYDFAGWSGDASGTTNPLVLTVNGDLAVVGSFALRSYTVDVTVEGQGTVTRSPNLATYPHGSSVTLTPVPATGWHFVEWTGDVEGGDNPLVVVVTSNRAYVATFAPDVHTVTATASGPGTVTRSPSQVVYNYGTPVTVTATPSAGHHFAGWSGDTTASTNPLSIVVTRDRSLVGTFAADLHPVDVTIVGSGTVSRNPDQPTYAYGTTVTLTATAATGWHFTGWSGDTTASNPTLLLPVNRARAVTATFAIDTYALDVTATGGGSVARSPDQPLYAHGTTVTLTATPDPGQVFAGWSGDASGTTNPTTVVMNGPRSVVATFVSGTGPNVAVFAPNGGEVWIAGALETVQWGAFDPDGVASIDVLLSRNGSLGPWETLATGLVDDGAWTWNVTAPPTTEGVMRVVARDVYGNANADTSDLRFEVRLPAAAAGDGPVAAFAIESVSPNPAAGPVQIGFALPVEAPIRLTVVDVQGRTVATLAEGRWPAGRHAVRWLGGDGAARRGAGVYFVRYDAGGRTFTHRLVLAR
jgi:hypothetical protein